MNRDPQVQAAVFRPRSLPSPPYPSSSSNISHVPMKGEDEGCGGDGSERGREAAACTCGSRFTTQTGVSILHESGELVNSVSVVA